MAAYNTRQLVALRPIRYGGFDIQVGDVFFASPVDASYFVKHNKASECQSEPTVTIVAVPAPAPDPEPEPEPAPARRTYTRRTTRATTESSMVMGVASMNGDQEPGPTEAE